MENTHIVFRSTYIKCVSAVYGECPLLCHRSMLQRTSEAPLVHRALSASAVGVRSQAWLLAAQTKAGDPPIVSSWMHWIPIGARQLRLQRAGHTRPLRELVASLPQWQSSRSAQIEYSNAGMWLR